MRSRLPEALGCRRGSGPEPAGPGQGKEAGDVAAAPGARVGGEPRTIGRLWEDWGRAHAAVRLLFLLS